jgi:uncharacterized phosphosugar-binding protein
LKVKNLLTFNLPAFNLFMSANRYFEHAFELLEQIRLDTSVLQEVAQVFADVIQQDKLIYTFGTGHSSLLAAEGLYRAGGLACVSAILEPSTTSELGMIAGSSFERLQGQAALILERYPIASGDVLVIYSNSGVNALPVEMVLEAKARGLITVAVMSLQYSKQAPVTSKTGQTLADVADYVIDNHVPPGDAVVPFYSDTLRAAALSNVAGAFIWNALVAETVALLAEKGIKAPVYISSNMPGAKEHNQALVEKYRRRIRHL